MVDFFRGRTNNDSKDNVLTVDSLHQLRKQRLETRQKIYDTVLDKCNNRIIYFNKYMHQDSCYFFVPEYIYGLPSFDIKKCTMYLMIMLRKRGFICEYHPQFTTDGKQISVLYISWNIHKIKKQLSIIGGPVRDDRYVFEKNNGKSKEYVFEKQKIDLHSSNLITYPERSYLNSKDNIQQDLKIGPNGKKYRKVKPMRPKKKKQQEYSYHQSPSDEENDISIKETENTKDHKLALHNIKLLAERIRQKNNKR